MALDFKTLFSVSKPVIGMIHLAGHDRAEKVKRALEELIIYEEEGVNGAIIENYHGDAEDVNEALKQSSGEQFKIVRGINVLSNPYIAFSSAHSFGARFVQFDSVQTPDLSLKMYEWNRKLYPNVSVLGGVRFKYTRKTGNPLELDLKEGKSRCEAIVTTGAGTGIETPIDKLEAFKKYLGKFPLIVGAGVTADNVYNQLMIADGAIVGSYFKPNGDTLLPVDRPRVKELMGIVKQVRKDYVGNN